MNTSTVNKVALIKEIRLQYNLGLIESKNIVEAADCVPYKAHAEAVRFIQSMTRSAPQEIMTATYYSKPLEYSSNPPFSPFNLFG